MPDAQRQLLKLAVRIGAGSAVDQLHLPVHNTVLLQPAPRTGLIAPCPAVAHGKLFIQKRARLRRAARPVGKDQRLALVYIEQLGILLPAGVRVDIAAQGRHVRIGFLVGEHADVRGGYPLVPHLQPCVAQSDQRVRIGRAVGHIQKDEVHACRLQHIGVLAVYPCVEVLVVPEVRLRPVVTAGGRGVCKVALQPVQPQFKILCRDILRRLVVIPARPAKEIEQPDLLARTHAAGFPGGRRSAVAVIGSNPRGIVHRVVSGQNRLVPDGRVREGQVVHTAAEIIRPQREVSRRIQPGGRGASKCFAIRAVHGQRPGYGSVADRAEHRAVTGERQGIHPILQLHGRLSGRDAARHLHGKAAFRFGYGHAIRREGEPQTKLSGGGSFFLQARADRQSAAGQCQPEGQIAARQPIVIAEKHRRTEGKRLARLAGQLAVRKNHVGAQAGCRQLRVLRVGEDIGSCEVVQVGFGRALQPRIVAVAVPDSHRLRRDRSARRDRHLYRGHCQYAGKKKRQGGVPGGMCRLFHGITPFPAGVSLP